MLKHRSRKKSSLKSKLPTLVLIISLVIILPFGVLQILARVYLQQGDQLLEQKQFDQAIASYTQALQFQPNFATIYIHLGKALQLKKQYLESLEAYQKALIINSDLSNRLEIASDLNNLGEALRKGENLQKAVIAYQKAIQLDPFLIVAYNNLGEALATLEQWDEAITNLNKAVQLDPNFAPAYINLGNVFSKQEQWRDAQKIYEKVLDLKPLDVSIYQRLGKVLFKQEKLEQAKEIYLQALALDPAKGELYNGLGEVFYKQKDIEGAIAAYQEALKLSPNAKVYENFCYARHSLREYEQALKLCKQAIKLDPTLGDAKFYVQEVERGLAIRNNPKLLQSSERLPSSYQDPLISLKRSVVKIIFSNSSENSMGTGWVVKREGDKVWIVTNRHVITSPKDKIGKKPRIAVEFYSTPKTGEIRKRRPAKIIQTTSEEDLLDLGLLEVTQVPSDIKPLIVSPIIPDNFTPVRVIGHPITGHDWSLVQGQVQSSTDSELYLSVVLASGNSGGPVLNSQNQVVGVVVKAGLFCPTMSNTIDLSSNSLGCGVAFPMEMVREKLKSWGY